MKILASSDFHGYLPEVNEPFDLFLICGDICPVECHGRKFQDEWLHDDFVSWINSLPFKTPWSMVVMTPGNHDFVMESYKPEDYDGIERMCNYRLKILRNESYEFFYPVSDGIDSLKIFCTPYCSIFGNWAFMRGNEILESKFSEIPEDTDILVSHDAPNVNKLGAITQGYWKSDTTGNVLLAKHIERVNPMLFVCGHFHSGNHEWSKIGETLCANVSYVNEEYDPYWPILSINYDEENRKIITEKIDIEK